MKQTPVAGCSWRDPTFDQLTGCEHNILGTGLERARIYDAYKFCIAPDHHDERSGYSRYRYAIKARHKNLRIDEYELSGGARRGWL
jgi:hypothetical protein